MNKKKVAASVIMAACCAGLVCAAVAYGCNSTFSSEDFIRFHVIANSNSDEDQALKLKVRDELLEYINAGLTGEAEKSSESLKIDDARRFIKENIAQIESEAEKIIADNGYNYTANAELGNCYIPRKTYGSVTFPAGIYEALNIKIGEAAGENWWCVLYPPLCLIDTDEANGRSSDALRDSVMQGKYSKLYAAAHGKKQTTIRLKFKTNEIFGNF